MNQTCFSKQIKRGGIESIAIAEKQGGKHSLSLRHERGDLLLSSGRTDQIDRSRIVEIFDKGISYAFPQSGAERGRTLRLHREGLIRARRSPCVEPHVSCRPVGADVVAFFNGVDIDGRGDGTDARKKQHMLTGKRTRCSGNPPLIPGKVHAPGKRRKLFSLNRTHLFEENAQATIRQARHRDDSSPVFELFSCDEP